eukprot:gene9061-biopygen11018
MAEKHECARWQENTNVPDGRKTRMCPMAEKHECARWQKNTNVPDGRKTRMCPMAEKHECARWHKNTNVPDGRKTQMYPMAGEHECARWQKNTNDWLGHLLDSGAGRLILLQCLRLRESAAPRRFRPPLGVRVGVEDKVPAQNPFSQSSSIPLNNRTLTAQPRIPGSVKGNGSAPQATGRPRGKVGFATCSCQTHTRRVPFRRQSGARPAPDQRQTGARLAPELDLVLRNPFQNAAEKLQNTRGERVAPYPGAIWRHMPWRHILADWRHMAPYNLVEEVTHGQDVTGCAFCVHYL